MPNQSTQILHNLYLFKEFSARELEQVVGSAKLVTYNSGDSIFAEGDEAHSMYVIKHGSVSIRRSGREFEVNMTTLGSSSHFGEIAFLDGEKRNASVTALEHTEIIEFEYSKLAEVLEAHPSMAVKFYRSMAHFLGNRLRMTLNDLSFAREKISRHI